MKKEEEKNKFVVSNEEEQNKITTEFNEKNENIIEKTFVPNTNSIKDEKNLKIKSDFQPKINQFNMNDLLNKNQYQFTGVKMYLNYFPIFIKKKNFKLKLVNFIKNIGP